MEEAVLGGGSINPAPVGSVNPFLHQAHRDLKQRKADLLSIYDAQLQTSKLDFYLNLSGSKTFGATDFSTKTPLHLASYFGNLEAAKILLKFGATIDPVDKNGNTPLILACALGNIGVVRVLINSGANLNKRGCTGCTPAMRAAQEGHIEILKLLLGFPIDLTLTSGSNESLLHHAAYGGPEVFSYLLNKGCCPYTENYLCKITPIGDALCNLIEFPRFLSLVFNSDLDFNRLNGILSNIDTCWTHESNSMLRFFFKRAPSNVIHDELEALTWKRGTLLSDAAQDG